MKKIEHKFYDKDIEEVFCYPSINDNFLEICFRRPITYIHIPLSDLEALAKAMGKRLVDDDRGNESAPYGYCPICGYLGQQRERRIDGNDKCINGHTYPSKNAIYHRQEEGK